jgi:outer membrane protein assembly factor BamB
MAQGTVELIAAYPAAGLSNSVNVTVDSVPPVFTISFSSPPPRAMGNVTTADQRDPGSAGAFRRDESVTVTVSANETVASFDMTVAGIGTGGNPGQTQTVTMQPAGSCGTSPFCRTATVDLSTLEMNVFRGNMTFRVEGQDGAGNRSSASATLPVTRWKWAYDAIANINGSPAVGAQGTAYVGATVGIGTGKVVALNPDGSRKWETSVGEVAGGVAVGAFTAGEEHVYVAGKAASGSSLFALRSSDGAERVKCSYTNATDVPGAIAVGTTSLTIGTAETGVTIYNGSPVRVVGVRPNALTEKCPEVSGTGGGGTAILPLSSGSSMVMRDETIFYATGTASQNARITSYVFGANTPRAGFPQPTNQLTRGMALSGEKVYAAAGSSDDASLGSLFSIPITGGALTPVLPASRVFNLAIGGSDVAFFGAETATTAELLSLPLGMAASPMRVPAGDTLRGAPVIARNDRLYTVNAQGRVSAWVASTLAPLWSVDVNVDLSMKDTSPNLDCQRDAGGAGIAGATTGTLYFVGASRLYAFIVDSPSLAANAPWPKFQRDARNTGNPATPVTNCPQ